MKILKSELRKIVKEVLEESQASDEAKKKGLKHVGFGHYADKNGDIVASSVDGKLVWNQSPEELKKHHGKDFGLSPQKEHPNAKNYKTQGELLGFQNKKPLWAGRTVKVSPEDHNWLMKRQEMMDDVDKHNDISYNIEKKHRHDSEKYKKDPDYKENIKKRNQAAKELNKWEKHPDNKKTADRLHKAGLVSRHEI